MVRVKVLRRSDGWPLSVEISGHALFGSYGNDIVCAAVSMLVQTIIFAAEDLLKTDPGALIQEGYVHLAPPANVEPEKREKLLLLVETMLLGLKETKNAYPDYIEYLEDVLPE